MFAAFSYNVSSSRSAKMCFDMCRSPEPSITWEKDQTGARGLPIGRYEVKPQGINTELLIKNVQQSDEGAYICRAANGKGDSYANIVIDVQGWHSVEKYLSLRESFTNHALVIFKK